MYIYADILLNAKLFTLSKWLIENSMFVTKKKKSENLFLILKNYIFALMFLYFCCNYSDKGLRPIVNKYLYYLEIFKTIKWGLWTILDVWLVFI